MATRLRGDRDRAPGASVAGGCHSALPAVRWRCGRKPGCRGIDQRPFNMNDKVLYRSYPIPTPISMKSYNAGSLSDVMRTGEAQDTFSTHVVLAT